MYHWRAPLTCRYGKQRHTDSTSLSCCSFFKEFIVIAIIVVVVDVDSTIAAIRVNHPRVPSVRLWAGHGRKSWGGSFAVSPVVGAASGRWPILGCALHGPNALSLRRSLCRLVPPNQRNPAWRNAALAAERARRQNPIGGYHPLGSCSCSMPTIVRYSVRHRMSFQGCVPHPFCS